MAVEKLELLLDRVRRYTGTQVYADSATGSAQLGVQTQMMIDLFNEAQHSLHGLVFTSAPMVFLKTKTLSTTSNQEEYNIPSDAFLGRNLFNVEYRRNTSDFYYPLQKKDPKLRNELMHGDPIWYIQLNKKIYINPVPQVAVTDGIRLTYEFALPELDIRRGKITAIGGTSTNPTSITCTGTTALDLAFAGSASPDYITVVSADGDIKMANISVSAYNSTTKVLTVSVSAEDGESIAVNDYVCLGNRSTNVTQLPEFCELYLTKYVEHAIMELTGHPSAMAAMTQLQAIAELLMQTFAEYNSDITEIPMHDRSRIINFGDY